MSEWTWTLQLRVPLELTGPQIEKVKKAVGERKGEDFSKVELVREEGGRFLQLLHVGPYENFDQSYARLHTRAAELDCSFVPGACREIYLSDPRRTACEKLKTIVRVGIE